MDRLHQVVSLAHTHIALAILKVPANWSISVTPLSNHLNCIRSSYIGDHITDQPHEDSHSTERRPPIKSHQYAHICRLSICCTSWAQSLTAQNEQLLEPQKKLVGAKDHSNDKEPLVPERLLELRSSANLCIQQLLHPSLHHQHHH